MLKAVSAKKSCKHFQMWDTSQKMSSISHYFHLCNYNLILIYHLSLNIYRKYSLSQTCKSWSVEINKYYLKNFFYFKESFIYFKLFFMESIHYFRGTHWKEQFKIKQTLPFFKCCVRNLALLKYIEWTAPLV